MTRYMESKVRISEEAAEEIHLVVDSLERAQAAAVPEGMRIYAATAPMVEIDEGGDVYLRRVTRMRDVA